VQNAVFLLRDRIFTVRSTLLNLGRLKMQDWSYKGEGIIFKRGGQRKKSSFIV